MYFGMKTKIKKEVLFARLPPDLISRLNGYVDEIYGTRFARSKVVEDAIEEYLKKETVPAKENEGSSKLDKINSPRRSTL